MKMLGLIGGLSWESTTLYYRIINQEVKQALGGLHSARLLLYSFDFEAIASLQKAGLWQEATACMIDAGQALKKAGAEALVICTNTMHKMAEEVEAATALPLIHIADCTGEEIKRQAITNVGLLGTQFTMEQPFYKNRLQEKYDLNVLVPDEKDRMEVHRIIYDELCKGIIKASSLSFYRDIILRLKQAGAQGVILGCTEIGLLMESESYHDLPLFDTTLIHAKYAAQYSLQ